MKIHNITPQECLCVAYVTIEEEYLDFRQITISNFRKIK